MGEMIFDLHTPDFGLSEQVGVGAMALAIDAAKKEGHDLSPLDASFDATRVYFRWPEGVSEQEALRPLILYAWQVRPFPTGAAPVVPIDPKKAARKPRKPKKEAKKPKEPKGPGAGVLYLPGIHRGRMRDDPSYRLVEHMAVLEIYLTIYKVQPKSDAQDHVIGADTDRPIIISYTEPVSTTLRYHTVFEEKLFERGRLRELLELNSFIFPGCTPRSRTEKWEGTGSQVFALLFMPTAALYFKLRNAWVVVTPEVRDLYEFVRTRPHFSRGVRECYVSNHAEAGLQVAVWMKEAQAINSKQFSAYLVGKVAWNEQGKAKKGRVDIAPSQGMIDQFEAVDREMPLDNIRCHPVGDTKEFYWGSELGPRGVIARNIAAGSYWYKDLYSVHPEHLKTLNDRRKNRAKQPGVKAKSIERIWFDLLGMPRTRRQLRSIMTAINKLKPDEDVTAFDEAFTETLRRTYGKIRTDALKRGLGQETIRGKYSKAYSEIYRSLRRATTSQLFSSFLMEFMAKPGQSKVLRDNRAAVWRFVNDARRWRQARDLALWCLGTYGTDQIWVGKVPESNEIRVQCKQGYVLENYEFKIGKDVVRKLVLVPSEEAFGQPEAGSVEVARDTRNLNWHPADFQLSGQHIWLTEITRDEDADEEDADEEVADAAE